MTDLGLMSNSKLLRVKNKQKIPYKSRKTPISIKKLYLRLNDRFGIICGLVILRYSE